jgi:hypothetical protein
MTDAHTPDRIVRGFKVPGKAARVRRFEERLTAALARHGVFDMDGVAFSSLEQVLLESAALGVAPHEDDGSWSVQDFGVCVEDARGGRVPMTDEDRRDFGLRSAANALADTLQELRQGGRLPSEVRRVLVWAGAAKRREAEAWQTLRIAFMVRVTVDDALPGM